MKHRLLLVNLALLALIGLAGWRLRQNWFEAREREQLLFGRKLNPTAVTPLPPYPPTPPLSPGAYLEVAQKMLFSRDRSDVVVIEPPPVKPMPALPIFYGAMDLGRGPTIILGEAPGQPHRGYRLGEQIGEFKLLAINKTEIEFEWDGKPVRRKLDEIAAKPGDAAAAAAPPPQATAPAPQQPGNSNLSPSASVLGGTVKAAPMAGEEGQVRPCVPGDTSPSGTVADGYKKIISETPFGKVCRWEPQR
ncbi:MAG: hypothetical protein SFV54_21770 [Bryobacteraceae bacterium]|nr:hypothetical protein [Bryobacteraceae bacterium]